MAVEDGLVAGECLEWSTLAFENIAFSQAQANKVVLRVRVCV